GEGPGRGRGLQPGNVEGIPRAASHVLARESGHPQDPPRLREQRRVQAPPERGGAAPRGTNLYRRYGGDRDSGNARQSAAPGFRDSARNDRDRLPPVDPRAPERGEPTAGNLGHLALAQGARE